jgi:hypothetical protein
VYLLHFPQLDSIHISAHQAACNVGTSYDAVVDMFECVANLIQRLHWQIYTEIPFTPTMTNIVVKILIEVLSVLALATKEIKQGRCKRIITQALPISEYSVAKNTVTKLLGESEIEDALRRLDRLTTQEGAFMAEVIHDLVNNVEVVVNGTSPLRLGRRVLNCCLIRWQGINKRDPTYSW